MKIAIFSDVHGNLEALQAVLSDMAERGIGTRFCLGDLVGYGPNPKEVCELIRKEKIECLKGNHDEAVSLDVHPHRLNARAAQAVLWTRTRLSDQERAWLGQLRYSMVIPQWEITLAHANVHEPSSWRYIDSYISAEPSLRSQTTRISFIGHTHTPGIFLLTKQDTLDYIGRPPNQLRFDEDLRCLVNVGSVGQPRDRNVKSCYVIYDTEVRSLESVRVPYPVELTQEKIRKAGLPPSLADRLATGS